MKVLEAERRAVRLEQGEGELDHSKGRVQICSKSNRVTGTCVALRGRICNRILRSSMGLLGRFGWHGGCRRLSR